MIKRTYVLGLLFAGWLVACSGIEHPKKDSPIPVITKNDSISPVVDTATFNLQFSVRGSYSALRNDCNAQKNKLRAQYLAAATDSSRNNVISRAGKLLEQTLVNGIFHHWYGTEWDFEGHTSTPRKGKVACGYFLSTTLQHASVNLNRYTLAQQNPYNEINSLSCSDTIFSFSNISPDSLLQIFRNNFPEGLYATGLGFHVGYLLFRKGELFFIHSNYINAQGVVIEKAAFSEALNASPIFYITPLTTNYSFIRQWLLNSPVTIIRSAAR